MFGEIIQESFDDREKRILKLWEENHIFEKSVENQKKSPTFTFYDGPPFATGLPHYGHLLAGTIKDVVLRYKSMKGFYAPRRFGWDCHGIPVESEIEKKFELSGAPAIEKFGIANFNEECRKIVTRYTSQWRSTVTRMGRWVDFKATYMTMDPSFMESVWWVFQQLYNKGLVYEGLRVMPFSAKLGTPLSNFEASENYREVDDPSITVAFQSKKMANRYYLAWTTTPWTLVSNLALMVGPEIEYVEILDHNSQRQLVLALSRLDAYFPDSEQYTVLKRFKGKELEKESYIPLFDLFSDRAEKGAFRILLEESVSAEDGTGVVQVAPAFGEIDFYVCQKEGIEPVCPINNNGYFTAEAPLYEGVHFKAADKEVIAYLKQTKALFRQATFRHRYPFCPRTDTPLMYKTVTTWFVAVEKLKKRLVELNEQIHWTPHHIQLGRFGKWLEGARDWNISRNRYWGTPIPLWRSQDGEVLVIGSIAELKELTGKECLDLHRHFIDELTIEKEGKIYHRIPEVFDCWFESGSMPYAQNHYPFENQALFDRCFPADFIAEGIDQTRGWFYTLHILATALFDAPAFKNVIVNGLILSENGLKMSKRLKNYPDPEEVIKQYGADAIRLYMLHSPAVVGSDLSFAKSGVELTLRQIMIPLWNAYAFFLTYARIYNWRPKEKFLESDQVIDQWIVSLLHQLIQSVEKGMDGYELSKAVEPFVHFVEQLTNWYIRRSRRRFWQTEETLDRCQAFATLYYVLTELVKIAAPFIPFISEAIYQNLRYAEMAQSVHLCSFPSYDKERRAEKLEAEMDAVQIAVGLGHALRKEHKLKVRQPLATAHILSANKNLLAFLKEQQHLIADELNVKAIHCGENESDFVKLKAKPNFRILGKKLGKEMPLAKKAIETIEQQTLLRFLKEQTLTIEVAGRLIELNHEEIEVERVVHEGVIALTQDEITIALETELSDSLLMEGLAREIINKINTMRREAQFEVTDRIVVQIDSSAKVKECFEQFGFTISQEVLANQVDFCSCQGSLWDLNGEMATIAIQKA